MNRSMAAKAAKAKKCSIAEATQKSHDLAQTSWDKYPSASQFFRQKPYSRQFEGVSAIDTPFIVSIKKKAARKAYKKRARRIFMRRRYMYKTGAPTDVGSILYIGHSQDIKPFLTSLYKASQKKVTYFRCGHGTKPHPLFLEDAVWGIRIDIRTGLCYLVTANDIAEYFLQTGLEVLQVYTYKPFQNHWIVLYPDGSIYCHCDSISECKEEISALISATIN